MAGVYQACDPKCEFPCMTSEEVEEFMEDYRIFEEELAELSQREIDSLVKSGFLYKESDDVRTAP